MASEIKRERIADRIQEILSEVLMFEVSDPRLSFVTVTDVKIDKELAHASVYVSAIGGDQEEVMAGLERAQGFLRRQVSQRIQLRNAPQVHFHWDPTIENAERINNLLDGLDIPPETKSVDADGSTESPQN